MAGDCEHDINNVNHEALRGFVDRLYNVENDFADVKAEYTDSKRDLKAEIKSRTDETGISVKQVEALVKIRLNEQAALDEKADAEANMFLYEQVYGFAPAQEAAPEDEEDDALG